MRRGLVISDLHLLSWRSNGQRLFEAEIRPRLGELDVLVLNGDIFDFRWAGQPLEVTIPEALAWLDELAAAFPGLEMHYIPGNHDCLTGFVARLKARPRYRLHPHYLVLGRRLFLHGDAANFTMDVERFRRFRKSWETDQPRGGLGKAMFRCADASGLSLLAHGLLFPQATTVKRIALHLDSAAPEWREDIEHCYFGHTHMPMSHRVFDGISFHNTGSAIRGMKFAPALFDET